MIIWIDKGTKQFFEMDTEPVGVDLESFDFAEIEQEELERVNQMKLNNTVIYENGEFKTVNTVIEPTKEELLQKYKAEISEIKNKKIERGIEIQSGVWHPCRDTDKINLAIVMQSIGDTSRKWKCYDVNFEPVLIDINKQIIQLILAKGMELLNGLIIGEAIADKTLDGMDLEQLKAVNIEEIYNKAIASLKGVQNELKEE